MANFLIALLSDAPEAAAMRTPQPATDDHYGLGLELGQLADGTSVIGHLGVNEGWKAQIEGYPDNGWGFVVLTNSDDGGRVIDAVRGLFVD